MNYEALIFLIGALGMIASVCYWGGRISQQIKDVAHVQEGHSVRLNNHERRLSHLEGAIQRR